MFEQFVIVRLMSDSSLNHALLWRRGRLVRTVHAEQNGVNYEQNERDQAKVKKKETSKKKRDKYIRKDVIDRWIDNYRESFFTLY